uniref:Uncharacterized protein n=1 Tax=Anabas testudineus TaxID=64144 RepID=A0AAQ6II68_ANATE
MASVLSEEQFLCSICLDIFKNPASIPCGHNFCLECIKRFWDVRQKAVCPLCKEVVKKRPELRVNVDLKDITEKFKRSRRNKPAYKASPRPRPTRQASTTDVPCDLCHGKDTMALISCLVCKTSYCESHLTPHLRDPEMTKHRLMDPATFTSSHVCKKHNQFLTMFCEKDQKPVCMKCTVSDHKNHDIVTIDTRSKTIKTQMKKINAEFQEMIQTRIRKTEKIKNSVELSRINKEKEIATSVQLFAEVISAFQQNHNLLIAEIEQKQEAAERRAEESVKELEQEIDNLQRRCNELQYLEYTEDSLHLIQSFPPLNAPLSSRDWSTVTFPTDMYMGATRRQFSKLVDICHELEKKLGADEVNKANQYAVDITLDPVTAAGWLIVSPDRKKVGDKTDWDLGVARESINRKGTITVRPDSGYWAICRRKGSSLVACTSPSLTLHLQEIPQKVGIFLDYEEGSVSFYDAEVNTHIYTYSGCNFTEPLYPYFNPCCHDSGKNTAPLIICPLKVTFNEKPAAF